jgi:RNA polymerase sigma-70 factor (ECF subfamily)
MAETPITDETARALRASWFAYVDTVQGVRPALHAYGLKLTGNVWDAEDLVQDTLLKGFAMIGRGDLHGPGSPVSNPKAYLFRTATNLWLDGQRRRSRELRALAEPMAAAGEVAPDELIGAAERLMTASPQARAAVVLKDVFEFSLEEIADQLRTTVGGVKAALHRGRETLRTAGEPTGPSGPSRATVDAFIDAFMSRDVARITASLTEACDVHVPGVGGGRGRRGGWAEASLDHSGIRLEPVLYHGEWVVLGLNVEADGPDSLYDVMRLEEADGQVSRIVNYCFCPDTLRAVGDELGLPVKPWGYHQPPTILPRMIATTTLPWGSPGATFHY